MRNIESSCESSLPPEKKQQSRQVCEKILMCSSSQLMTSGDTESDLGEHPIIWKGLVTKSFTMLQWEYRQQKLDLVYFLFEELDMKVRGYTWEEGEGSVKGVFWNLYEILKKLIKILCWK